MQPTYHICLKDGRTYTLSQLEQAGLSYVPCYPDKPTVSFANLRKRGKQVKLDDYKSQYSIAWTLAQWQTRDNRGVQIFTGKTSVRERDGNLHYLTDFDIEKLFIDTYPQAYQKILTIYRNNIERSEPVETRTKSGGKRLSAYAPALSKKKAFTNEDGDMIIEFFSEDGLSRYDSRYLIESGCLLNIPFISMEAAREIYAIAKEIGIEKKAKQGITDTVEIDDAGFPEDITYNADGISPYYPIRFCAVTQHKKHPETQGKVQYFKDSRGGERGHCYDCGEWWWKHKPHTPYRTAPDRLHITGTPPSTQDYEHTQADMTQQLLDWEETTRHKEGQYLLNIITPAQTGKTTVTITTAEKLTYITQTQKKAEEAHNEATRRSKNSYLHKSRLWNRDDPNWETLPFGTGTGCRPCIHPEICNSIASKGFSPVKEFCRMRCEKYNICQVDGYLSQIQKERLTDHVYFWQDEAFFADEIYQSRVQNVMEDKDAILAIDEPNPADLTQQRIIKLDALRQTFNNIRYTPAAADIATFLKSLLENLSTVDTPEDTCNALSEAIKTLSETDIKQFDEKLSGIPVSFVWHRDAAARIYAEVIYNNEIRKCYVVDDDDETIDTIPKSIITDGVTLNKLETRFIGLSLFERLGFIDLKKEADQAPRVYHNLISDITRFIKSDSHACHRTDDNTIVFYLPPSINARRGITMNASDTDNLISEVYHNTSINVETITGNPPPWKSNNLLFQISTGRYPPKKLFVYEDRKAIGIIKTMREFLNIVINTAEKYNVLVIGPKRMQDTTIDPLLAQINAHENITLDTHTGAQGKNEYQDRDVVFVFCFEPQPDIIEVEAKRIYRHARNLSFERDLVDVVIDNVKLTDVMRYTDPRVQKIHNLHCEKAHMQAILRLRQALNDNKTAILFSAEPVSQMPVSPIKYRKEQLLAFQQKDDWQLSKLQAYLEIEANRTPTEITEAEGVSIRTAYYKSETFRKQTKAEKKTLAKKLDEQGISSKKIIAELSISRRTFFYWKDKNFE